MDSEKPTSDSYCFTKPCIIITGWTELLVFDVLSHWEKKKPLKTPLQQFYHISKPNASPFCVKYCVSLDGLVTGL